MKKILLLAVAVLFAVSCESDDNNNTTDDDNVIGQWRLTEVLMDPGDGSGTFQPVESGKTLAFNVNHKVYSNGPICYMLLESDLIVEVGIYSESEKTISVDCGDGFTSINYDIIDDELILYYPCIEACQAKYTRVWMD